MSNITAAVPTLGHNIVYHECLWVVAYSLQQLIDCCCLEYLQARKLHCLKWQMGHEMQEARLVADSWEPTPHLLAARAMGLTCTWLL